MAEPKEELFGTPKSHDPNRPFIEELQPRGNMSGLPKPYECTCQPSSLSALMYKNAYCRVHGTPKPEPSEPVVKASDLEALSARFKHYHAQAMIPDPCFKCELDKLIAAARKAEIGQTIVPRPNWEADDAMGVPQSWRAAHHDEAAPATPPAPHEHVPTLTFGDGDYSCAICGMGMKEPCEHWKKMLATTPNFLRPIKSSTPPAGTDALEAAIRAGIGVHYGIVTWTPTEEFKSCVAAHEERIRTEAFEQAQKDVMKHCERHVSLAMRICHRIAERAASKPPEAGKKES
jgi:hypothetical protein